MVNKLLGTSLLSALLLLSACGNNEGEAALKTQNLLDKGQFNEVIQRVEAKATTKSEYLTLASAYMGKAGFSLTSLVDTVSSSNTNNNGGGEFSSFVKSVSTTSNTQSLQDITKAVEYYKKVVGDKCSNINPLQTLSAVDSDICLYIGLANVSQSAVAISYLTDNVDVLSSGNIQDDKLTASACAMQYAFNGTKNSSCTIVPKNDVLFSVSKKSYKSISVLVNAKEYEYLLSATPNGSTIITNGYCTLNDFTTRVNTNPLSPQYHVCPLVESATAQELTTEVVVINAINGAIDSIGSAVSADMKKDIDSFKAELLQTSGKTGSNTQITTQDIINYFNNNNK